MNNSQKMVMLYFNMFAVLSIMFAAIAFVAEINSVIDGFRVMTPVIQSVRWNVFSLSYTLRFLDFQNEVREYKILNTPIISSGLLTVINFSMIFIILPIYNRKKKTPFYLEENTGKYFMGIVIEALPDGVFQVELKDGHKVLAHTSETIKLNYHRIQPGEKVKVEMLYDLTRGLITQRYE